MLTKEEVISILQKSAEESQAATRVWLFGSYAKNTQNENSDVDVLIEAVYGTSDILAGLNALLAPIEELGLKTDIVTTRGLAKLMNSHYEFQRKIGEEIDRTKELIYESK